MGSQLADLNLRTQDISIRLGEATEATPLDTRVALLESRFLLGQLLNADFNTTADQAIQIPWIDNQYGDRYVIDRILVANPSGTFATAAGGIYTDVSKGGTAIVAASQVYTALSANQKFLDLTLETVLTTDALLVSPLYLSLTTAEGSASTADLYIFGVALGLSFAVIGDDPE